MFFEVFLIVLLILLFLQLRYQVRPKRFPPGPIGVPILGYMPFIKLPIHEFFAKLGEKYGSVFSMLFANHRVVILNDYEAVREAFKEDTFSGRPALHVFLERSWGKLRGIIFSTGKDSIDQRRFVYKNLREFGFGKQSMESLIKTEVVELIADLRKEVGVPLDLSSRFSSAVLNSLWHIIAGERYAQDDPRLNEIIKMTNIFTKLDLAGPMLFLDWYVKIFPKLAGWTFIKNSLPVAFKFFQDNIDMHRKTLDKNSPRDLIDMYLIEISKTDDVDSSFYSKEGEKSLLVVLYDLFMAGSDTTSKTINWSVFYLCHHIQVQEKLQNEIDNIVGLNRMPILADRQNMPYTESVIAEILRKSSIVALAAPHTTTEDVEFRGFIIPKNTIIMPNLWNVNHDKNYWGDPENFRPERFMTPDGAYKKNKANIPFSLGKRACIGESLVHNKLFLFITSIFQIFKIRFDEGSPRPNINDRDEGSVACPKPFKVILTLR